MQRLCFQIQGSAPEPYNVVFEDVGEKRIRATCTCAAGGSANPCKHRLGLILCDTSPELVALLKGSPLLEAVEEIARAEAAIEEAKKAAAAVKKKVGRLMTGV